MGLHPLRSISQRVLLHRVMYVCFFPVGTISSGLELLMIQQQNFGGSLIGTFRNLTATRGGARVLLRAAPMASGREACFAASYVGAVPITQRYLSSEYGMNQTAAALVGTPYMTWSFCVWVFPVVITRTANLWRLRAPRISWRIGLFRIGSGRDSRFTASYVGAIPSAQYNLSAEYGANRTPPSAVALVGTLCISIIVRYHFSSRYMNILR